MPLNQEAVDELRRIIKRECGMALSDSEAWETALNLMNYISALSHPTQGSEHPSAAPTEE
jgi:hypothetical protein